MAQKVYGPASEKQRLMLTAKEDIIFIGGASGSGKSVNLLMKNLDACQYPGHRRVRREALPG